MSNNPPEYDENFTMIETRMGWISVLEKLPKLYERVLVYDSYGKWVGTSWIVEIDNFKNPIWGIYRDDEKAMVTHWMALPEKP